MSEIEAIARKWGDSIAVIIPKDVVKTKRIKPKEKLSITINKPIDLSDLFGKFKSSKTAQELKDESRKGWE